MLGLLTLASCQKDDALEESSLSLSEVSLNLPKASSEKNITVTTNQTEWTAMANVNWLDLTVSGTTLIVKAAENTTTMERKGKIMVMAGGVGRAIEVAQAATDVTIVTIPDKLTVDQFGGNFQFDVNANTDEWTVTTDADWITVTAKQFKHEVVVNVSENEDREERVAKLILAGGETVKEFTITQSGIMYFILPYLGFYESAFAVRDFEYARRSEVITLPGELTDEYLWRYKVRSPFFDVVEYTAFSDSYKRATILAKDKQLFDKELPNFKAFLIENGFEDNGNNTYIYREKNILATIVANELNPYVDYQCIPKQTQAYPTFDKFPYGFTDFTALKAQISEYEVANGGTFNADRSFEDETSRDHTLWFDVKKGDLSTRSYLLRGGVGATKYLVETVQYYTKKELVFWEYYGDLFLTNEFMTLMKEENFEYLGIFDTGHGFLNMDKKLVCTVEYTGDLYSGVSLLNIRLYPMGNDSEAIRHLMDSKKKTDVLFAKSIMTRYKRGFAPS